MWALEYAETAECDFELIFDHLLGSYLELGDPPDDAFDRVAERLRSLRHEIDRLVETPYIGTLRSDAYPGIRFLRRDKAALWFLPLEERSTIVVAAIFYGGQDHIGTCSRA